MLRRIPSLFEPSNLKERRKQLKENKNKTIISISYIFRTFGEHPMTNGQQDDGVDHSESSEDWPQVGRSKDWLHA